MKVAESATPAPCVTRAARSDEASGGCGGRTAVVEHCVEAGDGAEQPKQLADAGSEPEVPQPVDWRRAVVGAPGEETGVAGGAGQHRQDDRHHRQACALELVEVCEGGRGEEGRDHSL